MFMHKVSIFRCRSCRSEGYCIQIRASARGATSTSGSTASSSTARCPGRTSQLGYVRLCLCLPHHPWQKGPDENANGLIRESCPKGTDFSKVPEEEARATFSPVDDRPRKMLGHGTAGEAYLGELLHLER